MMSSFINVSRGPTPATCRLALAALQTRARRHCATTICLVRRASLIESRIPSPESRGRQYLMCHRIEHNVDTDRVSRHREPLEVVRTFAFTLVGVAEIGVVRHHHDQPALGVVDAAEVRHRAVFAALRRELRAY